MPTIVENEKIIEEQMKTIGKLQDKINLMKFDISNNLKTITRLKRLLETRNKMITKTKEELTIMRNQNNYEDVGKIIKYLRSNEDEE